MWFQGSLLDGDAGVTIGSLDAVRRHRLSAGAWVDTLPGWVRGADELFDVLRTEVPWRGERREMYDRVVDVPRLLCFYGADQELPHPALAEARDALSAHYADELASPS